MTREEKLKIESLYMDHYKSFLAVAYKHTLNWRLAHDIVQEVFTIACEKSSLVCCHKNPLAWCMKTIQFLSYNSIRKRLKFSPEAFLLTPMIVLTSLLE